jgi:HSP20 family protein
MPWDPVRDLLTMQERLESLFGRASPGWVPAADLAEWPDRFVLTVELPGLQREHIHIEVHDTTVTVRGQRPAEASCPERYHQFERGQGQFSRTLRFSQAIAADAVTAELSDGVLTVVLPKAAPAARVEVR